MGILSFNYYYKKAEQPDVAPYGEWVPSNMWVWRYGLGWPSTNMSSAWVGPHTITRFSSKKYNMLVDNYTNQAIVASNPWYIDVRNAFIVTPGGGDPNSETVYTDVIKVSKFHPLHQRDQTFRLYFYMTDNFVTDTDPSIYFWVYDNTLINYYNDMVDKYYPVLT